MMSIIFFFMCLVASITGHRSDSMQRTVKELKVMNKTPIKSINVFHTPYIIVLFVELYVVTFLIIWLSCGYGFYRQNLATLLIVLILISNQPLIIHCLRIINCRCIRNCLKLYNDMYILIFF